MSLGKLPCSRKDDRATSSSAMTGSAFITRTRNGRSTNGIFKAQRSWRPASATMTCWPWGRPAGKIVFFDPDEADVTEIVRLDEDERDPLDDLRLWECADGAVMALTGAAFYRIGARQDESASLAAARLDIPWPSESARLLDASEARIVWALSRDELLVTRIDEPGTAVKLTAPDSTDEEFVAAAASSDGTVVAAICGSFLHIWSASEGGTGYIYLGLTPLRWGHSVAVSADGRYIAVGTNAGSALVYLTRTLEDS